MSDYKREVIQAYGLETPNFAGLDGYTVAKRSIFILDAEGMVRYAWVSEDPTVEPNYQQIQNALEKI